MSGGNNVCPGRTCTDTAGGALSGLSALYVGRLEDGHRYAQPHDATAGISTVDFVRIVRLQPGASWSPAGLGSMTSAGRWALSTTIGCRHQVGNAEQNDRLTACWLRWRTSLYFAALIAVNLAVMNLLPLPALDGGKNLLPDRRRRFHERCLQADLPEKYEAAMSTRLGFVLLMGLMLLVTFQDVFKLVKVRRSI